MPMKDIAGLFVSDMLADVRDRKPESIVAVDLGDRTFAVSVANLGAGLTDLSDIQITERTKLSIGELIDGSVGSIYGEYYRKLRREQQAAMRKMIANLLQRARKFNFNQYRDRLSVTGELTEGEKIHMDVLGTILNQRIRVLSNSVALKESLDG
jgi:hypothetical protein